MDIQEHTAKLEELKRLRAEAARLESELQCDRPPHWQAHEYYSTYHAASGFVLGIFGATASLLVNIIGALVVGIHPLRLIQVYLTFPLGARALDQNLNTGITLAAGVCLYVGTGMLIGVPFQMLMARTLPRGNLAQRLVWATVAGLLLWSINFYLILSWLQPLLFGGDWITDPKTLPPWVGALTHLVFAWTMALLFPWGTYVPYRRQTELKETAVGA